MEEPDEEKAKEAAEFFKAVYFGLTAEEKEEEPEECAECAEEKEEEPKECAECAEEKEETEECAECAEEKPSCSGKYAVRETESGFSFRLLAGNNQVIGVSEVYSGRAAMEKGIASVRKNAPEAKIEDLTDENAEKVTNPKFEIYNDKAGEFRFRLKARNGEIILASEGYKTKASCENGIESVRKNSAGEIAE
ncbi:MAG: YegP family protein [Oscillospiraceae bacterium]|nr:YegP family protein [Oscillospiraceae bacterium]